jgi:hypothetical protein
MGDGTMMDYKAVLAGPLNGSRRLSVATGEPEKKTVMK